VASCLSGVAAAMVQVSVPGASPASPAPPSPELEPGHDSDEQEDPWAGVEVLRPAGLMGAHRLSRPEGAPSSLAEPPPTTTNEARAQLAEITPTVARFFSARSPEMAPVLEPEPEPEPRLQLQPPPPPPPQPAVDGERGPLQKMTAACPEGLAGGDLLVVCTPDGEFELEVVVPDGLRAGDLFEVQVDPSMVESSSGGGGRSRAAADGSGSSSANHDIVSRMRAAIGLVDNVRGSLPLPLPRSNYLRL
jgi:hypothetical protein